LSVGTVSIGAASAAITGTAPNQTVNFTFPLTYGPSDILVNHNAIFQNSGYSPGITSTSTPSSFGFYSVGFPRFVINIADIFGGTGRSYRIRAVVRATGTFNDGLHCLIRRQVIGGAEASVPGLIDFGGGSFEIYSALSSVLTTDSVWAYYTIYFAAYTGGNGGVPQSVTVTFEAQ
jgi:hypothetical protein